ncbi:transposase [Exiguobacterium marinum]|uniref:Transposase n=1 Tax=Exiguobacterium marinum TaxID=273528 RepID=A0ABY7X072_9BACL|nr:transposase [Exiguobacterium marinum]WDH76523.1 transposase [Exiguobacterium marinum]
MTEKNIEFVKAIYETVIKEGLAESKEIYTTSEITSDMDGYWKQALGLYQGSDSEGQETLLKIIEQTMIETVSHMLGIIDGSSTLNDSELELSLSLDSQDTENELQDTFLDFIEENELYP